MEGLYLCYKIGMLIPLYECLERRKKETLRKAAGLEKEAMQQSKAK